VFTARYALSPYIKQIRFVFKGLIFRLFILLLSREYKKDNELSVFSLYPSNGAPMQHHTGLFGKLFLRIQAKALVCGRAAESESEGILAGVWVGVVNIFRLRLRPQSNILSRFFNSRALIATVTIRLIFKYRL
jgi:hypothetical protein